MSYEVKSCFGMEVREWSSTCMSCECKSVCRDVSQDEVDGVVVVLIESVGAGRRLCGYACFEMWHWSADCRNCRFEQECFTARYILEEEE